MTLSGIGIWSGNLRYGDAGEIREAAAELDGLGFDALWIPDIGGDVISAIDVLVRATTKTTVATGILNIWMHTPEEVAAACAGWGDRFLLGLGVSHAPLIDMGNPGRYTKPLSQMVSFLDGLDAAPDPVAKDHRALAALGPKMLELARTRTAGVHPYFVPPEHTAVVRDAVGPGVLVAPEQAVVLDTDRERAMTTARAYMATYLGLPNYTNNLLRLGYTADDIADGGSDRLVDAIVPCGDLETIAARIQAHRDAGADHVCVQPLKSDNTFPRDEWRELATLLTR